MPYFYQFLLGFSFVPLLFHFGRMISIFLLIFTGIYFVVMAKLFPDASSIFTHLALSALPIGIGLVPVNMLRGLDISYGLYIYHMLIVNIFLALGAAARFSGNSMIIIYFCSTLMIAFLSWSLIEKPALMYKSKIPAFLA